MLRSRPRFPRQQFMSKHSSVATGHQTLVKAQSEKATGKSTLLVKMLAFGAFSLIGVLVQASWNAATVLRGR